MTIEHSDKFSKKLDKLKKRDKLIENKIKQKLKYLLCDPKHPSLRLHKLKGERDFWSISIDTDLRVLFIYQDWGILLIDIGGHDEVY
jgi:mRNA-degrading endonuclease YafQ of YafQ-DinJ toxin-antitoxin module